jgi:hypothetical protein
LNHHLGKTIACLLPSVDEFKRDIMKPNRKFTKMMGLEGDQSYCTPFCVLIATCMSFGVTGTS